MLRCEVKIPLGLLVGLTMACALLALEAAAQVDGRRAFDVDKSTLINVGKSPFFVLVPGFPLHLAEDNEEAVIAVLDETEVVDGVETRVVEERETKAGELVEVSRNFFAIDKATGDEDLHPVRIVDPSSEAPQR